MGEAGLAAMGFSIIGCITLVFVGVIGFSGMGGERPETKGGSGRWQEPGAALDARGGAPALGARTHFAHVPFGQRGNGAGGAAGDRIHPTWPGWLSAWTHPHSKAQWCLLGWDCLAERRVPPPSQRDQRKPRPALSWCPANDPEPWLSPALTAPGAVGCFSSFPCASDPERKSPGRAGRGFKVASSSLAPSLGRDHCCAGLCREGFDLLSAAEPLQRAGTDLCLLSSALHSRGAFSFPAHAPGRDQSL